MVLKKLATEVVVEIDLIGDAVAVLWVWNLPLHTYPLPSVAIRDEPEVPLVNADCHPF